MTMPRFNAMLIFEYHGVAVVPARNTREIVQPEFVCLDKLNMEHITRFIPEMATGTHALIFWHIRDREHHGMMAIGDDGVEGLKLWILKLCDDGSLSAGPHPPDYDVTDNYIEVGTVPVPQPCKLGGFIHVWGSRVVSNERHRIPHMKAITGDDMDGLLAVIHFRPRNDEDLSDELMPSWEGKHMEVLYEIVNQAVPRLRGGDSVLLARGVKLFDFTFESFLAGVKKHGCLVNEDNVLCVSHRHDELSTYAMEVKGREGWEGLVNHIKKVILGGDAVPLSPMTVGHRRGTSWISRTGMLGRIMQLDEADN
ncbi:hypothetical protein FPOAC2_10375 [Fusarium poae]